MSIRHRVHERHRSHLSGCAPSRRLIHGVGRRRDRTNSPYAMIIKSTLSILLMEKIIIRVTGRKTTGTVIHFFTALFKKCSYFAQKILRHRRLNPFEPSKRLMGFPKMAHLYRRGRATHLIRRGRAGFSHAEVAKRGRTSPKIPRNSY